MAFYNFHQNNSGGGFDFNEAVGITYNVIIEADDAAHANYLAERIGLYFDGVETGWDCDCCGDRWYRAGEWDDEGTERPELYGKDVTAEGYHNKYSWARGASPDVFVHYADGRVVGYDYETQEAENAA